MDTADLISQIRTYDLERHPFFDLSSLEAIHSVYNGIGPDWLPKDIRDWLTERYSYFAAATVILSGNNSTADNYGVIGYAAYTGNPWYLNLSAGLNRQNYSSVRRADFTGFSGAAHGKFNGQYELRLMVALDVGGAIKGQHFDIYQGIGPDAGHRAGWYNHYGRVWVLKAAPGAGNVFSG